MDFAWKRELSTKPVSMIFFCQRKQLLYLWEEHECQSELFFGHNAASYNPSALVPGEFGSRC